MSVLAGECVDNHNNQPTSNAGNDNEAAKQPNASSDDYSIEKSIQSIPESNGIHREDQLSE